MLKITKLSTGFYHIQGVGPANWSQPPVWPCDEKTLRDHAFPEASEAFLREASEERSFLEGI